MERIPSMKNNEFDNSSACSNGFGTLSGTSVVSGLGRFVLVKKITFWFKDDEKMLVCWQTLAKGKHFSSTKKENH